MITRTFNMSDDAVCVNEVFDTRPEGYMLLKIFKDERGKWHRVRVMSPVEFEEMCAADETVPRPVSLVERV